jgi:hypothetical protein
MNKEDSRGRVSYSALKDPQHSTPCVISSSLMPCDLALSSLLIEQSYLLIQAIQCMRFSHGVFSLAHRRTRCGVSICAIGKINCTISPLGCIPVIDRM